jgi:hypothetical protein
MVALGIESGRQLEHVGGTELHTEAASFTALDDDGNTSFWHGDSNLKAIDSDHEISRDYDFDGVRHDVTEVTDTRAPEHTARVSCRLGDGVRRRCSRQDNQKGLTGFR